jgi:hypothetical protein
MTETESKPKVPKTKLKIVKEEPVVAPKPKPKAKVTIKEEVKEATPAKLPPSPKPKKEPKAPRPVIIKQIKEKKPPTAYNLHIKEASARGLNFQQAVAEWNAKKEKKSDSPQ